MFEEVYLPSKDFEAWAILIPKHFRPRNSDLAFMHCKDITMSIFLESLHCQDILKSPYIL